MPLQDLDADSDDSGDDENYIDSILNVIENNLGVKMCFSAMGLPTLWQALDALPADDSMKASLIVEALSSLRAHDE